MICCMNQWSHEEFSGTQPGQRSPGKTHSRPTECIWVYVISDVERDNRQRHPLSPAPQLAHFGNHVQWKVHGAGRPESWAWVQLCPHHSLTWRGSCTSALCPSLLSGRTGRGVTCVLVPHVQPLLASTIFWGCQPDWTLRKGPDNSRRAERKVWGQTRVRPTAAAAFESFLTRAEVRATPLSEMARWKRFLARGDNTWKDRVEKGSLCSQEGGRLFFQSHTHPQPCPGLFPWRPWAGLL